MAVLFLCGCVAGILEEWNNGMTFAEMAVEYLHDNGLASENIETIADELTLAFPEQTDRSIDRER